MRERAETGKGSEDNRTPNHEARRNSGLWCSVCGHMRGASCTCRFDEGAVDRWKDLAEHPIGKVLLEACGHLPQKGAQKCVKCGAKLRMDDTVAWSDTHAAMCVECYFKRNSKQGIDRA